MQKQYSDMLHTKKKATYVCTGKHLQRPGCLTVTVDVFFVNRNFIRQPEAIGFGCRF